MTRRVARCRSIVVLAVAVIVVLAGCGTPEAAGPFPPRPSAIDVDTLDPCEAVTDSQRDALGLSPGHAPGYELEPKPSRGCAWGNITTGYNYTVQTLPLGADRSVGTEGARIVDVSGFGAVQATSSDVGSTCQLVIDVGDDRALRVQAQAIAYGDDGRPQSFDRVCPQATQFAQQVLGTLTGRS